MALCCRRPARAGPAARCSIADALAREALCRHSAIAIAGSAISACYRAARRRMVPFAGLRAQAHVAQSAQVRCKLYADSQHQVHTAGPAPLLVCARHLPTSGALGLHASTGGRRGGVPAGAGARGRRRAAVRLEPERQRAARPHRRACPRRAQLLHVPGPARQRAAEPLRRLGERECSKHALAAASLEAARACSSCLFRSNASTHNRPARRSMRWQLCLASGSCTWPATLLATSLAARTRSCCRASCLSSRASTALMWRHGLRAAVAAA